MPLKKLRCADSGLACATDRNGPVINGQRTHPSVGALTDHYGLRPSPAVNEPVNCQRMHPSVECYRGEPRMTATCTHSLRGLVPPAKFTRRILLAQSNEPISGSVPWSCRLLQSNSHDSPPQSSAQLNWAFPARIEPKHPSEAQSSAEHRSCKVHAQATHGTRSSQQAAVGEPRLVIVKFVF